MSFFECKNASFLGMEINHLVDPFLEHIRDFFHGVNYGSDLEV